MNKPDVFFEICNLKWERIFLSLEVQTNCKDNATFSLERIGKIIHEEQEGTEVSEIPENTWEDFSDQPVTEDFSSEREWMLLFFLEYFRDE